MVFRKATSMHPMVQWRGEMDRLVHDFFGPVSAALPGRWSEVGPACSFPALNVWESGDALYAEAEVPGMKHEDLEISVLGNELTLRGRRGEQPREGATYHRQERGVGEFNRVLRLPIEIDADRVEASLKDGILLIKLPKAESAKPRQIPVHCAT